MEQQLMEMLKEMKQQMVNGQQQIEARVAEGQQQLEARMVDGQQQLEARMVDGQQQLEARIVDGLSARMDTALSNIKGHVIQLETELKQHERLIEENREEMEFQVKNLEKRTKEDMQKIEVTV